MLQRISYKGITPSFLCVAFMLWVSSPLFCQSVSGTVTANVARSLELSVDYQPLAFGYIEQGQTKTLLPNEGEHLLRFAMLGERGFHFTIIMPKTITLYGPGGATLIFIRKAVWMKRTTDFAVIPNSYVPPPPPTSGIEDLFLDTETGTTKLITLIKENPLDPPGGISRVYTWVGGEITASTGQAIGSYGGLYTVTVTGYEL